MTIVLYASATCYLLLLWVSICSWIPVKRVFLILRFRTQWRCIDSNTTTSSRWKRSLSLRWRKVREDDGLARWPLHSKLHAEAIPVRWGHGWN